MSEQCFALISQIVFCILITNKPTLSPLLFSSFSFCLLFFSFVHSSNPLSSPLCSSSSLFLSPFPSLLFQSNQKTSTRLLRFFKLLTCGPAGEVLKVDDMAELKRSITVKHNELMNKQKQNQKKGGASKPSVAVSSTGKPSLKQSGGRNTYGDSLDDGDDYDFL